MNKMHPNALNFLEILIVFSPRVALLIDIHKTDSY